MFVVETGKAARDMMFLTMALEQPHILVLSYAPGPIDTEMQVEARTKTGNPELRTMFQSKHQITTKHRIFIDLYSIVNIVLCKLLQLMELFSITDVVLHIVNCS